MTKSETKTENEVTESNRMWASASFVGILIIIGLPLWWKTTEVYRVTLPYDKIASFDPLSHSIATELVVLANDEATAAKIAEDVGKAFEGNDIINLKITKSVLSPNLQRTLDAVADEHEAVEEVGTAYDLKTPNKFYLVQRQPLFQGVWLGPERVMFFRDGQVTQTILHALDSWVYQTSVLSGARSDAADVARRTRFPPSPGYHVVLSVIQPAPMEFDAEHAVEDYIGTFTDELADLHNFTLRSQFLYMLNHDFQAKEIKDLSGHGKHFAVRVDTLHRLLTKIEERAATRVPEQPAINLALYVVPCHVAPLVIYDEHDKPIASPVQAFMSPKWGGVVFTNPTEKECATGQWDPDMKLIMGTFVSQLRKLVGICDTEFIPGAYLDRLRSVVPRRWELDRLLRVRTLEQLTSAERTLQSLAQLLGQIPNIVINDEVGASINLAVDSTRVASDLAKGGALLEAYKQSAIAFNAAETAFMEPSLLALLYFPDDQKYAIYIPLFFPIMFPVVFSLKNLILWLRGKPIHKEKTD